MDLNPSSATHWVDGLGQVLIVFLKLSFLWVVIGIVTLGDETYVRDKIGT